MTNPVRRGRKILTPHDIRKQIAKNQTQAQTITGDIVQLASPDFDPSQGDSEESAQSDK